MKFSFAFFAVCIFLATMVFVMAGCQNKPVPPPELIQTPTSTTTTLADASKTLDVDLGWANADKPERKHWSEFLINLVANKHFSEFNSATDNKDFCPKFASLSDKQKVHLWAEMLVWVMYYESSWKPTSWMKEELGIDAVTNVQVKSEGLLQLSYGDALWAKHCRFDWQKDKLLKQDDPKKTIFDPYINMECGIGILANQILKKGSITLSSNPYWSVLKIKGKYGKVPQIQAKTKALPFCS